MGNLENLIPAFKENQKSLSWRFPQCISDGWQDLDSCESPWTISLEILVLETGRESFACSIPSRSRELDFYEKFVIQCRWSLKLKNMRDADSEINLRSEAYASCLLSESKITSLMDLHINYSSLPN
jgi:hypothetical protein